MLLRTESTPIQEWTTPPNPSIYEVINGWGEVVRAGKFHSTMICFNNSRTVNGTNLRIWFFYYLPLRHIS